MVMTMGDVSKKRVRQRHYFDEEAMTVCKDALLVMDFDCLVHYVDDMMVMMYHSFKREIAQNEKLHYDRTMDNPEEWLMMGDDNQVLNAIIGGRMPAGNGRKKRKRCKERLGVAA